MNHLKKIMFVFALIFVTLFTFACTKEYEIKWVVEGEVVETDFVVQGEIPTYDGEAPTKEATSDYTFTFNGWTPEVVAAEGDATYTAEFKEVTIRKTLPGNVTFDSEKVVYDGEVHSLEIKNLPEGATVTYTNNGKVEPGNYEVTANVTYYGVDNFFAARLNIVKRDSVLTIEEEQTLESGEMLVYSLNNEEQTIKYEPIYTPGVYYVDVYAPESAYYNQSAIVQVKVIVGDAKPLGISFLSTTLTWDGTEKELLATDIPTGYTVTYTDNKLTDAGTTYATCDVFNATNEKVASIKAIFKVEYPENENFEIFLDEFLLAYLGDDYFAWNIYSVNPEALGFTRDDFGDPEWYSYTKYDEEFRAQALLEFKEIYDELIVFETEKLSENQSIAYEKVLEFVDFYLDYYDTDGDYIYQLQNLDYVDQFGGYCSDFATSMEGYTYRDEQDVKDVLHYIKSTATVYPTYVQYVKDRIEAKYPLSDHTLGEMIDYLEDVVSQGEDYYLIEFIQNKINQIEFLTDEVKKSYCDDVKTYFSQYFMPANQELITGLSTCLGHIQTISSEGYWAKYENGADLFLADLRDMIGNPDLTIEEYSAYIDAKMREYGTIIQDIISQYRAMSQVQQQKWMGYVNGISLVDINEPDAMIVYLKEFAKYIVPDLNHEPNVLVKYMDLTAASKSNAVAYYMRSAIDSSTDEYITLNPLKTMSDYNDTLSTMAHEGYPGHLYAHVFKKETSYHNLLKVMSSTAYSEGWATYVQLKLYDYMKETIVSSSSNKKLIDLAIDYMYYNQLVGYLLYNKIDVMIHVEKKSIADIAQYLDDNGYNSGGAQDIYRTLIEMPTGYTAYGYGMIFMNDLHIYCEQQLGDLYNEIDFNRFILSSTQSSLYELRALTEAYIKDIKFMYGE